MTTLGTFAFQNMTIEVSRTVGDLTGVEVLWLRRVDSEFPFGVGVVRGGSLVVTNHMRFRSDSPQATEMKAALDAFLADHGGPLHPGEIFGSLPRHAGGAAGA